MADGEDIKYGNNFEYKEVIDEMFRGVVPDTSDAENSIDFRFDINERNLFFIVSYSPTDRVIIPYKILKFTSPGTLAEDILNARTHTSTPFSKKKLERILATCQMDPISDVIMEYLYLPE